MQYLVRLCDICKDNVNRADEHAVLERMPRILDNGNYVGSLLGHVNQIAPAAMRELDRIHHALGSRTHEKAAKENSGIGKTN